MMFMDMTKIIRENALREAARNVFARREKIDHVSLSNELAWMGRIEMGDVEFLVTVDSDYFKKLTLFCAREKGLPDDAKSQDAITLAQGFIDALTLGERRSEVVAAEFMIALGCLYGYSDYERASY